MIRNKLTSACIMIVAFAIFAAASARAEAPIVEFAGYINGVMNIWATNSVAPASRVIQMKAASADESEYVDVAFQSANYTDNKSNVYNAYYLQTNWTGSASFRIANVDSSNVRTYASLGDFTATLSAFPTDATNSTYSTAYPA